MKILPINLFTVSALILSGSPLLSGTTQALKSAQIFSDLFIAQSSSQSISALRSGFYYATGTLFNYSRREILKNSNGRICMKVVEGPQNHLTTQQEDIIVSSLSSRQGKLYLDATNTEVEVYTPPELRRMFEWAQPETPVAFMDTVNQAALWEFIDSKPAQGSTAEQNKIMQECVQSRAQYIRRFKGHLIRGRS